MPRDGLPNIIAALLLVIIGSTVGQFAGQMVTQAAEDSGIDFAPSLGKMVSALIIFTVGMMAIGQLKIDTQMVRIVTCFVLGAGALAFGLAFGLGTRDIVRNLVIGFYTRKFLVIGKRVDIAGQSGVLPRTPFWQMRIRMSWCPILLFWNRRASNRGRGRFATFALQSSQNRRFCCCFADWRRVI